MPPVLSSTPLAAPSLAMGRSTFFVKKGLSSALAAVAPMATAPPTTAVLSASPAKIFLRLGIMVPP